MSGETFFGRFSVKVNYRMLKNVKNTAKLGKLKKKNSIQTFSLLRNIFCHFFLLADS